MSEPFIGEIRAFGFNFAPYNWALCNGALLPISQNPALFSILGVAYGGDGVRTFGLPNLASRSPVGTDNPSGAGSYPLGQAAGVENHTLTVSEIPSHTHSVNVSNTVSDALAPTNAYFGGGANAVYKPSNPAAAATLAQQTVAPVGGNLPHNNLPPYLALNYCIALQGNWPTRP